MWLCDVVDVMTAQFYDSHSHKFVVAVIVRAIEDNSYKHCCVSMHILFHNGMIITLMTFPFLFDLICLNFLIIDFTVTLGRQTF